MCLVFLSLLSICLQLKWITLTLNLDSVKEKEGVENERKERQLEWEVRLFTRVRREWRLRWFYLLLVILFIIC